MLKVGLLVKYFPMSHRISGLTSFATLLARELSAYCRLHVFSNCTEQQQILSKENDPFTLHRVKGPFWLRAGLCAGNSDLDRIVILSGIYKAKFFYPAFKTLFMTIPKNTPLYFYQGTIPDGKTSKAFQRMLTKRCTKVIGTNPLMIDKLCGDFCRKTVFLPPGIDLQVIRGSVAEKTKKIRIGYFNHFKKIKGVDLALEAFSQLPFYDTEYVVGGCGKLKTKMLNRYSDYKNIKFLGYVNDLPSQLKACDFIVLPFRNSASVLGISQTVLEAFAAGVPVIGSETEAIMSAVSHEEQGLIFKDIDGLKDCITRLHDDEQLRSKLSMQAFESAANFRIENIAKRLFDLVKEADNG
jgi:glycosyltransferase involved in cell wall biosynthesis